MKKFLRYVFYILLIVVIYMIGREIYLSNWSKNVTFEEPIINVAENDAAQNKADFGKAYDNGKEAVSDAYDSAKEGLGNAYDSSKEAVGNAYDETKETVGEIYDNGKEGAGEIYDESKSAVEKGVDNAKKGMNLD